MSLTDLTSAPAATTVPKAHTVGRADDVPLGEGRAFADGQSDLDVLVCPLHQYAYRWSDGASTSGAAPITTCPVREPDGYLVVEVRPGTRRTRTPEGSRKGRSRWRAHSGLCWRRPRLAPARRRTGPSRRDARPGP
jgi:nitrite reductase (NADH) small subunit